MSFEKKMKKRANQKLNAFAKNPYHKEPKHHRLPLWNRILIPVASAAAVLVIGVAVALPLMKNTLNGGKGGLNGGTNAPTDGSQYEGMSADKGSYPVLSTDPEHGTSMNKGDLSTKEPGTGDSASATVPWQNKTIVQKYPSFTYQNMTFDVRNPDNATPVESSYINQKLATVTVTGYDPNEDAHYDEQADIYSIKNIANDASLAIKFSSVNKYYAYHNTLCYFANMGELYNKLGFDTEVVISYVAYYYQTSPNGKVESNVRTNAGENFPQDEIEAIIFEDLTIQNKTAQGESASEANRSPVNSFAINITIKAIDLNDGVMQLYSDGTLIVNIFHKSYRFDLGEERYNAFFSISSNN